MKNIFIKIVAGFFYIAMVLVNFLANALPINNRTTGAISNAYSNLFAPAGLTFSIWGLIYLLLGGYIFYQFTKGGKKKEKLLKKINPFFITTSIANIAWIFSWHYDYIGLSLFLMLILLISLIKIADILRQEKLKFKEKLFISVPFSVYFGWITVATIANVTVFLVSLGWKGFGMADFIWTSIVLVIGALIGILRMRKDRSIAYGLVFIWAYFGIFFKHLSSAGFNGQYPSVILIAVVCLVLFGFFTGRIYCKK